MGMAVAMAIAPMDDWLAMASDKLARGEMTKSSRDVLLKAPAMALAMADHGQPWLAMDNVLDISKKPNMIPARGHQKKTWLGASRQVKAKTLIVSGRFARIVYHCEYM